MIAEGTSAELKSRLGGTVVEVRLHDDDEARRVADMLGDAGDGGITVDGNLVRVPASNGTRVLVEVVRRLDAQHVSARGLQLREPSLDDVFLSLTGRSTDNVDDSSSDGSTPDVADDATDGSPGRSEAAAETGSNH